MPDLIAAALVATLVLVALQGSAIVEQHRRIAMIRRQVLVLQGPLPATTDTIGKALPPLDGVAADRLVPVDWREYLPDLSGLVVVLDPIDESSWFIAEGLRDAEVQVTDDRYVVLLAGTALAAERFIRATRLPTVALVLVGPRSTALQHLAVRWRPAVLKIQSCKVVAAAQFHDAKQLRNFGLHRAQSGGDAV